jgi:hypothetical protein
LNTQGADQLVVVVTCYTNGNDVVRCNVLLLTSRSQKNNGFHWITKAYATAYLLPVCRRKKVASILMLIFLKEILCLEAAEIIVNAQQGISIIATKKTKLGYNRAGH